MSGFFGNQGNKVAARSREELLSKLSRVSTKVPPRVVPRGAERRTSDHRERFSIVHYLRALAQADRLRYPLVVEKVDQDQEPPDFMVQEGAGARVALEVTEAGTEKAQRAATEQEKSPPGTMLEGEGTPSCHPAES